MTNIRNLTLSAMLLIPLITLSLPGRATAISIGRQTVSAGGCLGGSGNMYLGGTVGQAAVGYATSVNLGINQGYWIPAEGKEWLCGDADASGDVDIDDVVYLIAYIFSGGPEPVPYESGDADCSGGIDIDDVVYLIAYIFSGGPEPCATCGKGTISKLDNGTAELHVTDLVDEEKSSILVGVKTDTEIQGVQLEFRLESTCQEPGIAGLTEGMQVFSGYVDGRFRVGMVDLYGETMIPTGESDLIRMQLPHGATAELEEAILVKRGSGKLNVVVTRNKAEAITPRKFELAQNYPNPFNPSTEIDFTLPRATDVCLVIYNVLGQQVAKLVDGYRGAGQHTVKWDASNASSGLYFYRIQAGDFQQTRKMLLLK